MASGGARVPARPAAVSGPGALSQRTDGGPGSRTQPIRVAPGGAYGQTQAAEQQQAAAPMSAGGSRGAPAAGQSGPVAPPKDIFGPTTMPQQPITAGVMGPQGGEAIQPDPDMLLRQIVQKYPTPWMFRLLRQRG